jgi:hypothetical protein
MSAIFALPHPSLPCAVLVADRRASSPDPSYEGPSGVERHAEKVDGVRKLFVMEAARGFVALSYVTKEDSMIEEGEVSRLRAAVHSVETRQGVPAAVQEWLAAEKRDGTAIMAVTLDAEGVPVVANVRSKEVELIGRTSFGALGMSEPVISSTMAAGAGAHVSLGALKPLQLVEFAAWIMETEAKRHEWASHVHGGVARISESCDAALVAFTNKGPVTRTWTLNAGANFGASS